jgi:hypothetical protein
VALPNPPSYVTAYVKESVAEAVVAAITESKAEWILLHSPVVKLAYGPCRNFFEKHNQVSDFMYLTNGTLYLNAAAASRVVAGAGSVRKLDGTLSTKNRDQAILVRRKLLLGLAPHPSMSVPIIQDLYVKAATGRPGCRCSSQKLTALNLESISGNRRIRGPETGKQGQGQSQSQGQGLEPAEEPGTGQSRKKQHIRKQGTRIPTALPHTFKMHGHLQNKPTTVVAAGTLTPAIAVAVQCHAPYLASLEKCMVAIEKQTYPAQEKFLILDNCTAPAFLSKYRTWKVVERKDGSPNPGRNTALRSTTCDWIWFVDADDFPAPDYLMGAARLTGNNHVGIITADLKYSDGNVRTTAAVTDYWRMRLLNYVSTESVWRVCALKEAGGWQNTKKWDDWTCALNVTALGWHTAKNEIPILVSVHQSHRNVYGEREFTHKWHRSYCVVSLLAGRLDIWKEWRESVLDMVYPAKTSFIFVDNSKSKDFGNLVKDLARALMDKGYIVQYLADDIVNEEKDKYSRHRVVAHLYNRACARILADATIFWEDDNIPGHNKALSDLISHWDITRIGGICAVYESRNGIGRACGTMNHDFWGVMPPLKSMLGVYSEGLGFIPGGFACYHTALVQQALPFHVDYPEGMADGWDGKLSRAVRASGMLLALDGTVPCEHKFRGTT